MGKHWRAMTTPRMQGRSAFLQGEPQTANPYEEETPTHRQWSAGYSVAQAKASK